LNHRISRLVSAALIGAALALPGSTFAGDPTPAGPPAAVGDWQAHLDHMRSMDGNLGTHGSCTATHGSMAGLFGQNGALGGMMDGGMMR
jgi:hypothetical protein